MSFIKRFDDQEFEAGIQHFLTTAPAIYLPGVSIDTVIFSFHTDTLKVLLLRLGNTPFFTLPGGFVKKEENLGDAALRTLQERTGLEQIYLEQFYTSGDTVRYKANILTDALKSVVNFPPDNWLGQRFISVCYYAMVNDTKVTPEPGWLSSELKWIDINEIPDLLYDHNQIIEKALIRLQADLDRNLVNFKLLDETFTMAELQKLYEAVFKKTLVRTNFQRKMLSLNILERLEKKYNGKAHKAPYLYCFAKSE